MVMIKRICLVLAFIACTLPVVAYAAEKKVSVMILPFEINAADNLTYLQTEIPKVIGQNLSAEGANIVRIPEGAAPAGSPLSDPDLARRMGVENGYDVFTCVIR